MAVKTIDIQVCQYDLYTVSNAPLKTDYDARTEWHISKQTLDRVFTTCNITSLTLSFNPNGPGYDSLPGRVAQIDDNSVINFDFNRLYSQGDD